MSDWRPMETAPKDGTTILIWASGAPVLGWWETGREFPGSPHFNDWSSGPTPGPSGYDCGFERIYKPIAWQLITPPEDRP